MLAPRPRFRVISLTSRYRRRIPAVRALKARNWSDAAIARHLGLTLARVRLAQRDGGGIWSPGEFARMRAALRDFNEGDGR